jgi:putative ATPase
LPEAVQALAQAAIYIACAPKSNAVGGYFAAAADVANVRISGVPTHLRDASYKSAHKLGHGVGYKYSHSFPGNYTEQQYLPDELVGKIYYEPSENGVEKKIKEKLDAIRQISAERA